MAISIEPAFVEQLFIQLIWQTTFQWSVEIEMTNIEVLPFYRRIKCFEMVFIGEMHIGK